MYSGTITFYAYQLKILYSTNNPIEIAKRRGIIVKFVDEDIKVLKASTEYVGDQIIIKINSAYTDKARRFLCAHELGHAICHPGQKHEYKNNYHGYFDLEAEHEANMFAAALMFPRNTLSKPIAYIDPVSLQLLIDQNIQILK